MSDHDGMFGQLALAGGQAISVGAGFSLSAITAGLASITPIGWIAIGVAVVVPVVVCVGASIYNASRGHEESSSKANDDPDPYARPNQKKQGRERKSKARTHPSWKPRTNPKPPKKHTPGRDHRKFIWILWMFGELINGIADWMLQ